MTIIDYSAGTLKDMGLAQAKVVTMDDKTTMEITLKPGFDWVKEVRSTSPVHQIWHIYRSPRTCPCPSTRLLVSSTSFTSGPLRAFPAETIPDAFPTPIFTVQVSPKLPGCPEWCPANHFGYLQSGTMKINYKDGSTETVNAGSSYNIPPGHLPEVIGDVPCVMVEFSQSTAAVVKEMKD